ncbi:MAG: recombinase family protein [Sphingobium sp.]|jgi:hypothetical protein|nr:recombinase family protein [Sphingobium sp.]MCI2054203.1 recombinase family protein [Sphingobium sp.]
MTKLRCAIYTRKSSDEGLEQSFNSLDAQREACAAYIVSQKSEGWILNPAYYDDGGISGGTMERPALQRLLADIGTGKIDIVVVYKVDRLTRSLADFARIVEAFDAKGVSFVSVTQAFNTTTSMGRLRTSPSGKVTGGVPFGRGPLFIMLRNRIYRGEINHKGTLYPGLHEAIIDAETFERVQQLLDTNSHRKGKRVQQQDDDPSPLMGLLYDDKGNRLTPVHGRNRRGRLYRYYIQPGLQTGQQPRDSNSIRRVPAPVIEDLVIGKLRDLMVLPALQWEGALPLIHHVDIHAEAVLLHLRLPVHNGWRQHLGPSDIAQVGDDGLAVITIKGRLKLRGGRTMLVTPAGQHPTRPRQDRALIAALKRAHAELAKHGISLRKGHGDMMNAKGISDPYVRRLTMLAFLAPDIQKAILTGCQPNTMRLADLLANPPVCAWDAQLHQFGL